MTICFLCNPDVTVEDAVITEKFLNNAFGPLTRDKAINCDIVYCEKCGSKCYVNKHTDQLNHFIERMTRRERKG